MNCVRTIGNSEFAPSGTIISNAALAEGIASTGASRMITEIALPFTLKSIGEGRLKRHFLISGTLTIPRNVENLAREALRHLGFATTAGPTVVFEPGSKLTTIGNSAFIQSRLKDFTLPANLEIVEDKAFMVSAGITTVDIRSNRLAKPTAATANFPLGNNHFQHVNGITSIKLPQAVYDSYTKAELQAIFGSTFANYRRPDGTTYDFASKA